MDRLKFGQICLVLSQVSAWRATSCLERFLFAQTIGSSHCHCSPEPKLRWFRHVQTLPDSQYLEFPLSCEVVPSHVKPLSWGRSLAQKRKVHPQATSHQRFRAVAKVTEAYHSLDVASPHEALMRDTRLFEDFSFYGAQVSDPASAIRLWLVLLQRN